VKVVLSIDVEAHRVLEEITGSDSDSLGDILKSLGARRCNGTFFVDVCEVKTWGREFMQSVCDRIAQAGHDIQLHVHPHHYTKDNKRWLLSEYSRREQEEVFKYAFAEFESLVGKRPRVFRAGGFGLNRDTLDILRSHGIGIDSSYMLRRPGCAIEPERHGVPSMLDGICEVPMTPAMMFGTRSHPLRHTPVDFNWLPLFVMKRILRRLNSEKVPLVVILMHSSSMCVRTGKSQVKYKASHVRKLDSLLRFLQEERLETIRIDQLDPASMDSGRDPALGIYVETNPIVQYVTLLFQSYQGAGFKPRFAAFLFANAGLLSLLLIILWRMFVYHP
jgi:peptidoglycan/xylan/chitin deacetylase (PgdA/CDA1 family)